MFAKTKQIQGVTDHFIIDNNNLYLAHSNGHLSKYDFDQNETSWNLALSENPIKIGFLGKSLFCSMARETKVINPLSGKIENQHPFKVIYISNSGKRILAEKREDGQKRTLLLNEELTCLAEKDIKLGKNIFIDKEHLVSTRYLNDQVITGYTLENLVELWSTNIAEHGKFKDIRKESQEGLVTHILGLYDQTLWAGLSSGKLIGLDYTNGSLKFSLGFEESILPENISREITSEDYLPFGELMQLDLERGEIFGLRDEHFLKADLGTHSPKREYFSIANSMKTHGISSSYRNYDFPYDKKFIYFCDDRKGKIGVFDRERKETIWSTTLSIPNEGIAKIIEMKVSNNIWCILDRNNTLHIFERT